MVGVAEAVGLLASMMGIVDQIMRLADEAQRNREKCALLKDHVQMIKLLLKELKSQWMPDPVTYSTLKQLEDALNDGKVLVESCREKRTWSLVFRTQKKAKKIIAVDERISKILESFHIANTILIVSINKERFFMTVLEKLLRNGACRRLPQGEKEELKSSIQNLTNMDNMSSEAKSVMELIISDLTDGDEKAARRSVMSSVGPGGRGDDQQGERTGDNEVVSLALSIVREANGLRQNRREIQQLVQFVQQIADLMQQPQSSKLSWDPNTRSMVSTLKQHLQDAYKIVLQIQQHRNNTRIIAQTFLCGVDDSYTYTWQQPDIILKVAYKIEYYVQVLPVITMRQMCA